MKTITKTLAGLGLAAIGLAGCAESNEKVNATDPTGKLTQGVTPAGAARTPEEFGKQNPGSMRGAAQSEKYKKDTGQ